MNSDNWDWKPTVEHLGINILDKCKKTLILALPDGTAERLDNYKKSPSDVRGSSHLAEFLTVCRIKQGKNWILTAVWPYAFYHGQCFIFLLFLKAQGIEEFLQSLVSQAANFFGSKLLWLFEENSSGDSKSLYYAPFLVIHQE